jgi:hypothetical protein
VLASLTKGGLAAATRSLAVEYAKRGGLPVQRYRAAQRSE